MYSLTTDKYLGKCTDASLRDALLAIRSDPELRIERQGICSSVDLFFSKKKVLFDIHDSCDLRHLMSLWPKFSGYVHYPVPPTIEGKDSSSEYHQCPDTWNQETEYGKLRWELLEFCIQRLEDRIYEDKVA